MKSKGFTLIELLVVVAIIGVLATVVLGTLGTAQEKARVAKTRSDLKQITNLISIAHINTDKTLLQITGSGCSTCVCTTAGLILKDSISCVNNWKNAIDKIVVAAGIDISLAKGFYQDPWGNPYLLDENEGEGGDPCRTDSLGSSQSIPTFARPISATMPRLNPPC
jgi:prepilin-type N-terminal cleavage/methylation domain-containing protein